MDEDKTEDDGRAKPRLRLVPPLGKPPKKRRRPSMHFMDLWFFAKVLHLNQHSQDEVYPESGEAAAARRLHRAGLIYRNLPICGYSVSEAGWAMAHLFVDTLNDELETERRR